MCDHCGAIYCSPKEYLLHKIDVRREINGPDWNVSSFTFYFAVSLNRLVKGVLKSVH